VKQIITFEQQRTQEYLLISDIHLDNPKCRRDLLKRHLDQAMEKKAPVFINGDLFCAMQGNKDRRAVSWTL
jgi:UDP-2,3-diacylglucosamine pyrophosphatase LpxH